MYRLSSLASRSFGIAMAIALGAPSFVSADHGPGTTGGSVLNRTAATLPEGKFALTWRTDATSFESLRAQDIERRVRRVRDVDPEFDAVRWSLLETIDLSYGVLEDFELSVSFGFYRGDDVREGEIEDGDAEVADHGDVQGLTDLWFTGKYRFLRERIGSLAVFGGVKLPLGRDDVRSDAEGRRLEPSVQPGSGAFDALVGGAYSVFLTKVLTLDASFEYSYRGENDDFKIGDRLAGGVSLAWRLIEDPESFPQITLVGELHARHLFENEEYGNKVANSGGWTLFLSPGVRIGLSDAVSLLISPQFPVWQDLRGEQQETRFKGAVSLTVMF